MNYTLVNSLIDKATEYMSDAEAGRYNIPNFHRHDFAKLIIEECANRAWDEVQYATDFDTADKVKKSILSHFGLC